MVKQKAPCWIRPKNHPPQYSAPKGGQPDVSRRYRQSRKAIPVRLSPAPDIQRPTAPAHGGSTPFSSHNWIIVIDAGGADERVSPNVYVLRALPPSQGCWEDKREKELCPPPSMGYKNVIHEIDFQNKHAGFSMLQNSETANTGAIQRPVACMLVASARQSHAPQLLSHAEAGFKIQHAAYFPSVFFSRASSKPPVSTAEPKTQAAALCQNSERLSA